MAPSQAQSNLSGRPLQATSRHHNATFEADCTLSSQLRIWVGDLQRNRAWYVALLNPKQTLLAGFETQGTAPNVSTQLRAELLSQDAMQLLPNTGSSILCGSTVVAEFCWPTGFLASDSHAMSRLRPCRHQHDVTAVRHCWLWAAC